jgi:hypothetical protein
MVVQPNITGKIDTKIECEDKVRAEIARALASRNASNYSCIYGDDPAGDLALKFENGDKDQTIVIEVRSWPALVYDRIVQELAI